MPKSVNLDATRGLYVGQQNLSDKCNGRGAFIADDYRSIYEGFFKNGKKHGPGRLIRLHFGTPYVKVRHGNFKDGHPDGRFKTTLVEIEKSAKGAEWTFSKKEDAESIS